MLPAAKAVDYITKSNVFNWVFLVGADRCCLYAVVSLSQNGNVRFDDNINKVFINKNLKIYIMWLLRVV